MKIPVTAVNIGPVHKKDVLKAMKSLATQTSHKEFATILAFDVKVTPEAAQFAEDEGIKIFTAEIIYHLFDEFTEYVKTCREARKGEQGRQAIFPCILEVSREKDVVKLILIVILLCAVGQRRLLQPEESDHCGSHRDGGSTQGRHTTLHSNEREPANWYRSIDRAEQEASPGCESQRWSGRCQDYKRWLSFFRSPLQLRGPGLLVYYARLDRRAQDSFPRRHDEGRLADRAQAQEDIPDSLSSHRLAPETLSVHNSLKSYIP